MWRIRPAGTAHRDGRLQQPGDGVFHYALDGPSGRLPLPAAELGPVVLEHELNGARWHVPKLPGRVSRFKHAR